jgi:S1-C subfamily serine protease
MPAPFIETRRGGRGLSRSLAGRCLPLLVALEIGLVAAAAGSASRPSRSDPGLSVGALSRQVELSVVDTITFVQPAGTQILGTGIIVSSSGLVLTDYHVVRGDVFIGVRVGGAGLVRPASVVIDDPSDDLALLQIEGGGAVKPAELETSPSAAVGDPVVAIGNAMGLDVVPRAASGRLLALDRTVSYGVGSTTVSLAGIIEAATPIFTGDSGGALVNAEGRVIGMIAAGSDDMPCAPAAVCPLHLAFAIPIGQALTQIGFQPPR